MRGSVLKRGKNSWRLQIYTGKDSAGKLQRHVETVRGRKCDAGKRLRELLTSLDKGIYAPPVKLTVADLLNQWLEGYVKNNCAIRTQESYQSTVDCHLAPGLGHIQLNLLRFPEIEAYYSKVGAKLSAKSVLYHHRLLKQALKYGVRKGYLGSNPCDLVDPPKPRKKPMRTLTPEEVGTLLDVAADNQFYPVIYTALNSGLRQAELLGLRWRDINLELCSISVCQVLYKRGGPYAFKEPKTQHSKRRVSMTNKLRDYLSEYKGERESLCLHSGRFLKPDDLVFANTEGGPIDPSVLSHNFARIAKRAGLKDVRFHDLRHTFASLMLLCGAKSKIVSEALGHSSVAFTLDTYGHIIPGMDSEAMGLLDKVMPPGKNTNSTPTF